MSNRPAGIPGWPPVWKGPDDGVSVDEHRVIRGAYHEHHYQGQMLRHGHIGGVEPHGYYEHPEDAALRPEDVRPILHFAGPGLTYLCTGDPLPGDPWTPGRDWTDEDPARVSCVPCRARLAAPESVRAAEAARRAAVLSAHLVLDWQAAIDAGQRVASEREAPTFYELTMARALAPAYSGCAARWERLSRL